MKVGKIPVVKVGRGGASGTPEEFEQRYERDRKRRERPANALPRPKLPEIKNTSLSERLSQFGIEEIG